MRTFRIRKREVFSLFRVSQFKRVSAIFAEELLVVIFVMTVFDDVVGATFRAVWFLIGHIGIPPLRSVAGGVSPI